MSHEKSVTLEFDGKFVNLSTNGGKKTIDQVVDDYLNKRIKPLGGGIYGSESEAVEAAKERSKSFDVGPPKSLRDRSTKGSPSLLDLYDKQSQRLRGLLDIQNDPVAGLIGDVYQGAGELVRDTASDVWGELSQQASSIPHLIKPGTEYARQYLDQPTGGQFTELMEEMTPLQKASMVPNVAGDVADLSLYAKNLRDPKYKMGLLDHLSLLPAFNMGMAGMVKAFHGTPHKWEGDKFRMDKVGTGEGGQSYGYGGYFAENPKVAGLYQKAFSGEIELSNNSFVRFGDDEWTLAHTELRNAGGDFSKARASATNINEDFIRDAVIKELDTLETRGAKLTQANLYNIELDVNHEDLLDWDAPLSEQPQKIQDGVKTGMREHNWSEADIERVMKESNGQQALNYLMPSGNKAQASETLKNAGIPGIRYLDAGSRGAKEGTRNLVIFDEDLIKIADEAKNIDDFAANLEKKHGLSKLHLYERRDGSINLSQIEVPKANRKQGIGSGALQDIVDYADSQGKRVVLSTAQKFSGSTTSSARLKKFYKRFGFVENKGRNKDFTISDSMYREPK